MKPTRAVKLFFFLLVPFLLIHVGSVFGSSIKMEIFYLPHRPAVAVVEKIDTLVAEFENVVTEKYNFEDSASKKILKEYKLSGHMPVAIFINGKNSFTVDGKTISLSNFPKGDAFVPTFTGEWDYSDLRKILADIAGGK